MRANNKDILIGYIGTLTDKECKDIYYLLNEIKVPKGEWLEFDKVRITQSHYSKLIWMWGKNKTDECIDILNKWLIKKNIAKPISHYRQLLGWVEGVYYTRHPMNDKSIKYKMNIDTAWKAKKYIHNIPPELRAYDIEVKFLVDKYGPEILKD